MTARRAALVGMVFVVIAVFYWVFQYLVDPLRIDYAGITMLLALGAATSIMMFVLFSGQRSSQP